jgi:hypothetical protein
MKKNIFVIPILVFTFFSCGDSAGTVNSSLEKEKLELDKKKLELDEAKFKANQKKNDDDSEEKKENIKKSGNIKSEYKYLLGKWNGTLRNKKLSIIIDNIDGNTVSGYNIAGANKRPLTGRIYPDDHNWNGDCLYCVQVYKLILSEPGDDKWDGVFTLYFYKVEEVDEQGNEKGIYTYSADGNWKSNSGKLSGEVTLSK